MTLMELAQKMRSDVAHISNPNIVTTANRCAEQVEQWAREKAKEWVDITFYDGDIPIANLGVPEDNCPPENYSQPPC